MLRQNLRVAEWFAGAVFRLRGLRDTELLSGCWQSNKSIGVAYGKREWCFAPEAKGNAVEKAKVSSPPGFYTAKHWLLFVLHVPVRLMLEQL
jgi:hypothetical protein